MLRKITDTIAAHVRQATKYPRQLGCQWTRRSRCQHGKGRVPTQCMTPERVELTIIEFASLHAVKRMLFKPFAGVGKDFQEHPICLGRVFQERPDQSRKDAGRIVVNSLISALGKRRSGEALCIRLLKTNSRRFKNARCC